MLTHTTIAPTYAVLIGLLTTMPAAATPFFFSTGNPDARMATASQPGTAGKIEIESGDDFVLTSTTTITSATFTGLLTQRDRWRSSGRNIPGVSERLECSAHQRASYVLDIAGAYARQFALGC